MSGLSRISSPGERILTAGAGPSSSSGLSPVGANAACAACKYQRRKCAADCPLAPYFPPDQPKRFLNVHRLFGVSSILRILRQVDPDKREDTVKSIVYEADTREKDPVHGCLGIIHLLQNQVYKLKEELATTRESLYLLEQQHASSILQQNFVHQHAGSQANYHYHLQSQYNPSTSHHTGHQGGYQGGFHESVPAAGQLVSYQDSRAHAGYHDHSSRYLVSDQDSALQDMLGHSIKVESDNPYNRSSSMGNMRYVSDPGGGSLHLPDQQPNLGQQQHHHHSVVGGSNYAAVGGAGSDLDRRAFNYPLADNTPPSLDRHVDPLRSVAALQVLDPLANHSSHVADPELRNAGVHLSLTNQYSM